MALSGLEIHLNLQAGKEAPGRTPSMCSRFWYRDEPAAIPDAYRLSMSCFSAQSIQIQEGSKVQCAILPSTPQHLHP